MLCLHQVAVPEQMYIATFYHWRPGQSWSVMEGEGVALELAPRATQVFQNWISLAPTDRF